MYVCLCKGVTEKTVRACIREGAGSVAEVGRGCGAGTDCGSCAGTISELIEEHGPSVRSGHHSLPMLQAG